MAGRAAAKVSKKKKFREEFGSEEEAFNDYFKMTYGGEMDFVTFKVESMIVPPVKTNEDKFFELFRKK